MILNHTISHSSMGSDVDEGFIKILDEKEKRIYVSEMKRLTECFEYKKPRVEAYLNKSDANRITVVSIKSKNPMKRTFLDIEGNDVQKEE
jgi:hypothetical protein